MAEFQIKILLVKEGCKYIASGNLSIFHTKHLALPGLLLFSPRILGLICTIYGHILKCIAPIVIVIEPVT